MLALSAAERSSILRLEYCVVVVVPLAGQWCRPPHPTNGMDTWTWLPPTAARLRARSGSIGALEYVYLHLETCS